MTHLATSPHHCYILLPSHSLDEFPTNLSNRDAADLLAAWSCGWHPAILASTKTVPQLLRAGAEEIDFSDSIVFVPLISERYLSDSLIAQAKKRNVDLIRNTSLDPTRDELGRDILIQQVFLSWPTTRALATTIDPDLVADFFALAFAYLQVQILTRQLRYSTNFNEASFHESLLRAVDAATLNQQEVAEEQLTACFDLLMEERNSYYPIRPQLIDLVLLAESTLGESLLHQLKVEHPLSLLLTGELVDRLAHSRTDILEQIRVLMDDQKLAILGGVETESPEPLLSVETSLRQLQSGRDRFLAHLGTAPKIFARRRFGLSPSVPELLAGFDFAGALHVNFDDGRIPVGSSVNIRWTGLDGSSLSAHCEPPLDANDSSTLLKLGLLLGRQMDSTHTAVALFAHWPARTCTAFKDLIRIQKYAPVLGHFVHLEEYFETLYDPGYGDTLELADYRTPFLRQSVEQSQLAPLSRYVDYWQTHYCLLSCRAMLVQRAAFQRWNRPLLSPPGDGMRTPNESSQREINVQQLITEIRSLERQLDTEIDAPDSDPLREVLDHSQKLLCRIAGWPATQSDLPNAKTWAVFNTLNFKRRTIVTTPVEEPIELAFKRSAEDKASFLHAPVLFADQASGQVKWVLELSGNSLTSLPPLATLRSISGATLSADPAILDGMSLKNEFFELQIDPKTGGLRTLTSYQDRQNLIGQQLAVRIPETMEGNKTGKPNTAARYTEMRADRIETVSHSQLWAAIISSGRLIDSEQTIASFRQTITVSRGIPIAELDIEFEPAIAWPEHPNFYLCNRLAWKDEDSELECSNQEFKSLVSSEWFHATNFVTVKQGQQSITLLTGGLPHHRRASRRMLDSLLMLGREQRRKFRFGLGVNLTFPFLSAASRLTPAMMVREEPFAGQPLAPWFVHFDHKNILVTWWEPEFDAQSNLVSIYIRCRETEGRAGTLTVSFQRPITSASLVNFTGRFLRSLVHDLQTPHQVVHAFHSHECFQIKIQL